MEGQYGHEVVKRGGGSMSSNSSSSSVQLEEDHQSSEDDQMTMMMASELRRGPWTVEEDLTLMNYIANHGEGRWNSLARCAGLKRTGKSCRLRWLNYLRPDVRRGNITLEEQLLILELHSRWGNRWSKIAQHLPGRTDNEIKNYWRTRVQKHAKQLKCDVNSKQFKDTMRYLWMPRLVERIHASSSTSVPAVQLGSTTTAFTSQLGPAADHSFVSSAADHHGYAYNYNSATDPNPNNSADDCYIPDYQYFQPCANDGQAVMINGGDDNNNGTQASLDHHFQDMDAQWSYDQQTEMGLWNNVDDIWFLHQQLNSNAL